jgi:hypothetical protein
MTPYEYISIFLTLLGILLIPASVLLYRAIVKWTRTESQLMQISKDLRALIEDKDKTHADMLQQIKDDRESMMQMIKEDRKATNERLTWLEHNLWTKKQ